jgi:hypothetical protein
MVLFACQPNQTQNPSDLASQSHAAALAKARQLQQRLAAAEPALPVDVLNELKAVARTLVALEVGTERHPSAGVYFCERPTSEGECAGIFADDTSHTLEFPHTAVLVSPGAIVRIAADGLEPESLRAWWQTPQGPPLPLASQNGALDLSTLPRNSNILLVVVLKGKGNPLFEKHVWVVTLV